MNNIKNIIIIYDYGYINGGAAKVAINNAISLSKIDNLNVFYYCGSGPICEELIKSKVNIKCLNLNDINHRTMIDTFFSGIFNKKVYKNLKLFLKDFSNKDTMIHIQGWSHSLSCSIFKAINELGFKRVITLHDYFTCCPNGGFLNYKKYEICKYKALSVKCKFCNCDKRNYLQKVWRVIRTNRLKKYLKDNENFIYLSKLSKDVISKYYPNANYYYYPNEIDKFKYISNGISNKEYFLYMGRITKEKGVVDFCEAITLGRYKGIVIGDGEQRQELEKKYPNIEFLGWLEKDQIEEILPKVKALVFPSIWYEVSPLTVPEMLSSHIPCIVSDCCAAKEHIVDGLNGFVYKASSISELLKYLKSIDSIHDFVFESNTSNETKLISIYMEIFL
ncbi:MAG: glycosyltransferase [Bacilli bacterium]